MALLARTMVCLLVAITLADPTIAKPPTEPSTTVSITSGRWSDPSTWGSGRVPRPGDRVQIRAGHVVTFESKVESPIRSIHLAGTLRFDPSVDTILTVGLIKIRAGDDLDESGLDCEAMVHEVDLSKPRPALEVGTPDHPIESGKTALIRLAMVPGLDPEDCPAILCCGGRMDFHGSPMSRTWVKLGQPAKPGDSSVNLAEPVDGWRVGDRVILTSTTHPYSRNESRIPRVLDRSETEERFVRQIEVDRLTLDRPLDYAHAGSGGERGEVASLSRNVVIESADPSGDRGHTMYHRQSRGSISYAEFRHLGKSGKLGKYSIHFHRGGDTLRGTSILGASVWESGNRWVTIHGTNNLVIRDTVGYRSVGHGFFLEDGSEVDTVFDRNLAIQALGGSPLPGQILPYDKNDGAGFWWANSSNSFTRNVAVDCEGYGYRFDARATDGAPPLMMVRGSDGTRKSVDIRTLPFVRFEGNEAHSLRRYGINLGGASSEPGDEGVGSIGPDSEHPFVLRSTKIWESRWGLSPGSPSVLIDRLDLLRCDYGFWRPVFDRHAYRDVTIFRCGWPYYDMVGTPPTVASFPGPLRLTDSRPPVSVILQTRVEPSGEVWVRGLTVDDGEVRSVLVNGQPVRPLAPNFLDWEITLAPFGSGPRTIEAIAQDSAGHREQTPHVLNLSDPPALDRISSHAPPSQGCP